MQISNGRVTIQFGNEANNIIVGLNVTLTPYETPGLGVVWRCGYAPDPIVVGSAIGLMGNSGGGQTSAYVAPTLPPQYLPASCRQ